MQKFLASNCFAKFAAINGRLLKLLTINGAGVVTTGVKSQV